MIQLVINGFFMERVGEHSLIGALYNAGWKVKPNETINLVFEQTSDVWKQKHNGPDSWIMPEHAVRLFMEDVIALKTIYNCTITTEIKVADPGEKT